MRTVGDGMSESVPNMEDLAAKKKRLTPCLRRHRESGKNWENRRGRIIANTSSYSRVRFSCPKFLSLSTSASPVVLFFLGLLCLDSRYEWEVVKRGNLSSRQQEQPYEFLSLISSNFSCEVVPEILVSSCLSHNLSTDACLALHAV